MSAKTSGGQPHAIEDCLERGEVVFFEKAPFALPAGEDHEFLLRQSLGGGGVHKNISYNPYNDKVGGFSHKEPSQRESLRRVLAAFSASVVEWTAKAMPAYSGGCTMDRVSFRPEEEATRRLRQTARNDLLHVDAFPGRPARGRRILRVFANVNRVDPRVWNTSDPLPRLVERYGKEAEQSSKGRLQAALNKVLEYLRPWKEKRAVSDWFMLKLHDYLKGNHEFQQKCTKRLWSFPPGSAWLAMTDACSHAVLRGQFALEHSFFIEPQVLVHPELTPEALLRAA